MTNDIDQWLRSQWYSEWFMMRDWTWISQGLFFFAYPSAIKDGLEKPTIHSVFAQLETSIFFSGFFSLAMWLIVEGWWSRGMGIKLSLNSRENENLTYWRSKFTHGSCKMSDYCIDTSNAFFVESLEHLRTENIYQCDQRRLLWNKKDG